MPVTFSSYRLGPGQRVSNKTVPPPWDWLFRRENELGPRRSKSRIIFAVLVPPLYVAVQAPALIVTVFSAIHFFSRLKNIRHRKFVTTWSHLGKKHQFSWYPEKNLKRNVENDRFSMAYLKVYSLTFTLKSRSKVAEI